MMKDEWLKIVKEGEITAHSESQALVTRLPYVSGKIHGIASRVHEGFVLLGLINHD
jgi:hypothetical protein